MSSDDKIQRSSLPVPDIQHPALITFDAKDADTKLLGQRRHDIPRLVWFFIHAHQRELGRRITNVPPPVVDALQKHSWPGNVRELAIGKPRFADGQMGILTGGCS